MEVYTAYTHYETEQWRMQSDYADHNLSDPVDQRNTLITTIETLEERQIPYALIGGLAARGLGRPRVTHDIDIFVKPDDADKALEALEEKGFKTEKRDPAWLFKAWKNDILVDIVFKSSGDIYFDEDIQKHVRRVPFEGHYINSISPEDLVVIKAAVHQEHIPHHWHDALAVLMEGDLDWEYLIKQARHAPRRVLSLLIYAQSNDIAIPFDAIEALYRKLFDTSTRVSLSLVHPYREGFSLEEKEKKISKEKDSLVYTKGKIMEALSTDERTADHDIKIVVTATSVDARGEVFTNDQKQAVQEVVKKISPDKEIRNYVRVRSLQGPEESEVIQ